MYYCTTSTLDITPEAMCIDPEIKPVDPETQDLTPVIQTTHPSPSGLTTTADSASTPKMTTAARIAALERLILENNDSPRLRRVDMAHELGVGLSRIKDDLRLLAAQGKVVFVGVGSHSGHWHLEGTPETEAEVVQWLSTPGYNLLHGSRGRHEAQPTPRMVSTPAHKMSPDFTALDVAHVALNCALAAVQTPYAQRQDICCAPYRWHAPFYFTRRLWQDALAPLQPLRSRG